MLLNAGPILKVVCIHILFTSCVISSRLNMSQPATHYRHPKGPFKHWFLTTTQWRLCKCDAARRSQSCGFEDSWFLSVALMSVLPWHCADAAASCGCGNRSLTSAWWRTSLVTTGRKSCCLFTAVVFLYTMSCKEEFDEKLIDRVRSLILAIDQLNAQILVL